MKKVLFTIGALSLLMSSQNVSAQLPDNGIYPGGLVITDLNGTQHDIDAVLASGKSVVLDLFAEWCGPCWNYHSPDGTNQNAGALKTLYNDYGPDGTDELMVYAVEVDPNTAASTLQGGQGTQGWDWITGTPYPMANQDNVAAMFNLSYYPTIVMICPDRIVTEVGASSVTYLYNASNNCGPLSPHTNDPRLITSNMDRVICPGAELKASVVMQNNSSENLTSATIELFEGNTSILTYNWTGNITPYSYEDFNIGTFAPTAGSYKIRITSTNDNVSNDEITVSISNAPIFTTYSDKTAAIEARFDNYASEFALGVAEGMPPTSNLVDLYSMFQSGNIPNTKSFVAIGSLADGTHNTAGNPFVNPIYLDNPGCHFFTVFDQYGDGINYQTTSSYVKIAGPTAYQFGNNYGIGKIAIFDVVFGSTENPTASIMENNAVETMSLYPNPASESATLVFDANSSDASVEVINSLGQTVHTVNLGTVNGQQQLTIPTATFAEGLYFVTVKTKTGSVATARLSVVK
jgi:thiol-disulfide isomerase/thioredoxin